MTDLCPGKSPPGGMGEMYWAHRGFYWPELGSEFHKLGDCPFCSEYDPDVLERYQKEMKEMINER